MRGCLMPIAVCSVDFGRRRALRTSEARRPASAATVSSDGRLRAQRGQRGREPRGERRRERAARGRAQQEEIDQRQRARPFLQEPDARVDHARADEQRDARDQRDKRRARATSVHAERVRGAIEPSTPPMNAGSAITSRDSHDVRHFAAARHARSGRPRWKNEATRPRPDSTQRDQRAGHEEARFGHGRDDAETRAGSSAYEREEQALPRADQRREEDDRERGMHAAAFALPGRRVVERRTRRAPASAACRRSSSGLSARDELLGS